MSDQWNFIFLAIFGEIKLIIVLNRSLSFIAAVTQLLGMNFSSMCKSVFYGGLLKDTVAKHVFC